MYERSSRDVLAAGLPVSKERLRALLETITDEVEHGGFINIAQEESKRRRVADRMLDEHVNVFDFIAAGDHRLIQEETTENEYASEIERASLEAASANRALYLPGGMYNVGRTLAIRGSLRGAGIAGNARRGRTRLRVAAGFGRHAAGLAATAGAAGRGPLLRWRGYGPDAGSPLSEISGIMITGRNDPETDPVGIELDGLRNFNIDSLNVYRLRNVVLWVRPGCHDLHLACTGKVQILECGWMPRHFPSGRASCRGQVIQAVAGSGLSFPAGAAQAPIVIYGGRKVRLTSGEAQTDLRTSIASLDHGAQQAELVDAAVDGERFVSSGPALAQITAGSDLITLPQGQPWPHNVAGRPLVVEGAGAVLHNGERPVTHDLASWIVERLDDRVVRIAHPAKATRAAVRVYSPAILAGAEGSDAPGGKAPRAGANLDNEVGVMVVGPLLRVEDCPVDLAAIGVEHLRIIGSKFHGPKAAQDIPDWGVVGCRLTLSGIKRGRVLIPEISRPAGGGIRIAGYAEVKVIAPTLSDFGAANLVEYAAGWGPAINDISVVDPMLDPKRHPSYPFVVYETAPARLRNDHVFRIQGLPPGYYDRISPGPVLERGLAERLRLDPDPAADQSRLFCVRFATIEVTEVANGALQRSRIEVVRDASSARIDWTLHPNGASSGFVGARGRGVLASAAELAALAAPQEGNWAIRTDTGTIWTFAAGNWTDTGQVCLVSFATVSGNQAVTPSGVLTICWREAATSLLFANRLGRPFDGVLRLA